MSTTRDEVRVHNNTANAVPRCYSRLLLTQTRTGIPANGATRLLRAIDEASNHLGILADDLRAVSRIRLGQLPRPGPVSSNSLRW